MVGGYLKALRQNKKEKPDEIKEALEIYIRLWEEVIRKGVVRPEDEVGEALRKIDARGGLYGAAEG